MALSASQMCSIAGQRRMFLHLRFQDKEAGALYRKTGWEPVREDLWAVTLLGLDRRFLMAKKVGVEA